MSLSLGEARGPRALTVYAGELFFVAGRGAEQGLFRVDLEGKKSQRMPVPLGPKDVGTLRVADGALYWLAGKKLYMLDVAGGAQEVRSFEAECRTSALAVRGRTAFCGGYSNVIAVDTKTGEMSSYGDPHGDRAVAIEARKGEVLWTVYDDRRGAAAVRRAVLK